MNHTFQQSFIQLSLTFYFVCLKCWEYRHDISTQEAHRQAHLSLPTCSTHFLLLVAEASGAQRGEMIGLELHVQQIIKLKFKFFSHSFKQIFVLIVFSFQLYHFRMKLEAMCSVQLQYCLPRMLSLFLEMLLFPIQPCDLGRSCLNHLWFIQAKPVSHFPEYFSQE